MVQKDLSRQTVVVLVVLTVVFSVLGALTVLNEADRFAAQSPAAFQASGDVKLEIVPHGEIIRTAASEGAVNINIQS